MKIVIIDGQGGKMGKMLAEQLKLNLPEYKLYAIGTNGIATAAMLKAGADIGATGENPVVYNSADADIITGPMGIVVANSFHGELTPAMALAVSQSRARKVLIPIDKCNISVVGTQDLPFNEYVRLAVQQIKQIIEE